MRMQAPNITSTACVRRICLSDVRCLKRVKTPRLAGMPPTSEAGSRADNIRAKADIGTHTSMLPRIGLATRQPPQSGRQYLMCWPPFVAAPDRG